MFEDGRLEPLLSSIRENLRTTAWRERDVAERRARAEELEKKSTEELQEEFAELRANLDLASPNQQRMMELMRLRDRSGIQEWNRKQEADLKIRTAIERELKRRGARNAPKIRPMQTLPDPFL